MEPLIAKDEVIKIILAEYHRNPRTKPHWKQQREANLINAYRYVISGYIIKTAMFSYNLSLKNLIKIKI